jgi:hypothetical protein
MVTPPGPEITPASPRGTFAFVSENELPLVVATLALVTKNGV